MSFEFIKDKSKEIYFVGIGGISMSGLASIMLKNGFKVSGSDKSNSEIVRDLIKKGAKINIGQRAENIKDPGLIVYTAAISNDNPELVKAREKNIPMMTRAEFLGNIMKGHKYNVAISGTHGKTTTTSMISYITLDAKLDPTILVGGELDAIGGNVRAAKSDYFITEACEYKASFLKFYPYIGVILNIDADHLDFYKDIDDIKNTFIKFAKLIPENGFLVINADDKRAEDVIKSVNCSVITYGIEKGMVNARNIKFDDKGCCSFDVYKNGELFTDISLKIPGKHNIYNALASIGASLCLNINKKNIKNGLEKFKGPHRRFEIKGTKKGVTVIDDYAHHPTEVKATLNTAFNFPHKRIFCVFQPHTYSRTIALFKQFTECFDGVDELVLADIYAAREKDTGEVSSQMLCDKIKERGQNCICIHSFSGIVDHLKSELKDGDVLITVGAGDVYKVGELFLK